MFVASATGAKGLRRTTEHREEPAVTRPRRGVAGERNGIVTSRICNILHSRTKISREGERIVFNTDLTGLAELIHGAVKRRAIDTKILR